MSVHLLGLGTTRPPESLDQAEAADMAVARCCTTARQEKILRSLYAGTTIEARGCALLADGHAAGADPADLEWFYPPDPAGSPPVRNGAGPSTGRRMEEFRRRAPDLAARACAAALRDAGLEADRVTHLVVATCTGFAAPGLAIAVIGRLGLAPTVKRVEIGFMGCHAAFNALQVAAGFATSDPDARVVVCCTELCSLHFQYGWVTDRVVANALFADGAGAAVLGHDASSAADRWCLADTATTLLEGTEDEMSWNIGDHGFVMSLSARVPAAVAAPLRPWLDGWLERRGRSVPQIASWAIHAGGPRVVDAVIERLGIAPAQAAPSRDILRRYGNMSSATILFILEAMRAQRAALPCVALGFGPGLVVEGALFEEGPVTR